MSFKIENIKEVSDDYDSELFIIDPKESKIAEYLKISFPGIYALKIR